MNQKKQTAELKVLEIRRHTRKKYSAEEKIRIVIEGLRGESSIAELCRKEGINANLCYKRSNHLFPCWKAVFYSQDDIDKALAKDRIN